MGDARSAVVPTHVGVHRCGPWRGTSPTRRPHARGGAPLLEPATWNGVRSSPRTWGCTAEAPAAEAPPVVVPTHVGVHRPPRSRPPRPRRRPHARGGAPSASRRRRPGRPSSPRTWGCTVQVFAHRDALLESSPRTWGCTGSAGVGPMDGGVVPTHVGVHRTASTCRVRTKGRPHARGGAPRTCHLGRCAWMVVPTHVGVHRRARPSPSPTWRRPHARGGAPGAQRAPHPRIQVVPTHVGVHRRRRSRSGRA